MNTSNFGIAAGRLSADPKFFPTRNGSYKVMFRMAVDDNFKKADGTKGAQFLPFEHLISEKNVTKDADGNVTDYGVYSRMGQGDKITVQYSVRNNNYRDKNGVDRYELTLYVETVKLEDSKKVAEERRQNKAAAAAAPASAPAEDADEDTVL